jgi:hypothetical protein
MPPFDEETGTSSVPENTSSTAGTSAPANEAGTPDTTAETQAAASPGENSASPPDAPVDDRAGLLAAVQKVVQAEPKNPAGEGSAAAPDGSSTNETKTDPQAEAQAAALEADPTEDELKALAPKTKARIEKLLDQRRAARQEVEALKPQAAKWQQMEGYLTRHDLAAEDANTLLGIGAALRRGDFKTFVEGVGPYWVLAHEALGLSVAPDLRAKVDAGEMSEDAAKQLTATRIANSRLQGQVKANTEAATAQRAEVEHARTAQAVGSAIAEWEAGIKARDPDYAKKAAAVEEEAQLLIKAHGHVKSVEEGLKIAQQAYDRINRLFAAGRPTPAPSQRQPSGARAVNGARAEPKSMMEAAQAALDRMRA